MDVRDFVIGISAVKGLKGPLTHIGEWKSFIRSDRDVLQMLDALTVSFLNSISNNQLLHTGPGRGLEIRKILEDQLLTVP